MSVTHTRPRPAAETGFPNLLREWRQKRRLSQLDLALSAGVSQRHVSFLESGRANPSRGMILQLSETLEVPLRDRNAWLTAAGFAPVFRTRALDDPQMGQVLAAVRMMLTAHEPFPAIALDRGWNVRMSNRPFDRLGAMLGEDIWTRTGCGEWVTNIDQRPLLDQAAQRRSLETLAQALRATRQTADELERNANPRLALEVLFLSWPE